MLWKTSVKPPVQLPASSPNLSESSLALLAAGFRLRLSGSISLLNLGGAKIWEKVSGEMGVFGEVKVTVKPP